MKISGVGQLKDIMGTIEAIALNKPVIAANIYQADQPEALYSKLPISVSRC
jgi:hypothetical protein